MSITEPKPLVSRYQPTDPGVQPAYSSNLYLSTLYRAPQQAMVAIPQTLSELTGPVYGHGIAIPGDADLTTNAATGAPPLGERMVVAGRVLEEDGRPVPNTLIEVWQCNSAGRYSHAKDIHDAPLDPNFLGAGRVLTDEQGRYEFTTIKPGAYPWRNNHNAWRPAHIHFSLLGPAFITRLVTQMYFPGDPLLERDAIFMSVPTQAGRERLISQFEPDLCIPGQALGYRFDMVLRGREEVPQEAL